MTKTGKLSLLRVEWCVLLSPLSIRRFSHYSSLVDKGFEGDQSDLPSAADNITGLSAEKRAREALNEAKTKEMQLTDSRLQLALEVEQQVSHTQSSAQV